MLTMFVFSCSCSLKTLTCAVRFATASALKGAPPGKYFRLQNWKTNDSKDQEYCSGNDEHKAQIECLKKRIEEMKVGT